MKVFHYPLKVHGRTVVKCPPNSIPLEAVMDPRDRAVKLWMQVETCHPKSAEVGREFMVVFTGDEEFDIKPDWKHVATFQHEYWVFHVYDLGELNESKTRFCK